MLEQIKNEISRIIEEEKLFGNNYDALSFMEDQMNSVIIPMLRYFSVEAEAYCVRRDAENVRLQKILTEEKSKLVGLFSDQPEVEVRLMSSVGARLNVIGESDIDFGICVQDLNCENGDLEEEKYKFIGEKLKTLGFVHSHDFNVTNPSNRYFSFTKIVNCVEIEAKVRDYKTTKVFIKLHEKLDNDLSEEQIVLCTYAKFLLSHDKGNKQAYKNFKKILYESVFCGIDGAFVFPV